MNVSRSVTAYRQHMNPFAGRALLGSPAVTNGGGAMGLNWLGWFLGNCTDCRVDFINIHWYSNPYAFTYLQYQVEQAYQVGGGRPIWITEFGMDSGTEAQIQAFMKQAVAWLDTVPYVVRYAWFGNFPNYLLNPSGTGLSAQGVIYNNYTANYMGPPVS